MNNQIIEKQLGIKGDYQYKALRGKNFLQANWHNNKLEILSNIIKKYKPNSILDLGTGSGNFELRFADSVDKIVGIDYNSEALLFLSLQLKKRKIKNVELIQKDILAIPKEKSFGRFDMIIMIDVIEHLDKTKEEILIKHFKKLLNKDGKVVIVTPNYKGIWPVVEKSLDLMGSVPHLENMQHVTKFDENLLRKLFFKYGYKQNLSSTFNTFSFMFPDKKVAAWLSRIELGMKLSWGSLLVSVFESR